MKLFFVIWLFKTGLVFISALGGFFQIEYIAYRVSPCRVCRGDIDYTGTDYIQQTYLWYLRSSMKAKTWNTRSTGTLNYCSIKTQRVTKKLRSVLIQMIPLCYILVIVSCNLILTLICFHAGKMVKANPIIA